MLDGNGTNGILANAGSFVRISNCQITANVTAGVNFAGGSVQTFGDNQILGNSSEVLGGSLTLVSMS